MATADGVGNLLVVDDIEMNRDVLSRRLRRQGHIVEMAENGRRALEMLRSASFDIVLLDIMMPEMNGYQVLEEMKEDLRLRHIPVIMVSAVTEIESVVRCIEMGAEDYLLKPFNPVLLSARINAVLEKKRLRDQEMAFLQQIEQEKQRADDLLHVILPEVIVTELKANNSVKPRRHENVAVMVADVVGFTSYCDRHEPEEVIGHLQDLVETFESLAVRHGLEKIKTMGDGCIITGGLLHSLDNPALACVRWALDMLKVAPSLPAGWQLRIGLHVGPLVAGIVGHRQYLFDIWGDTVNMASRVQGATIPNTLSVSRAAWEQVAPYCLGESRGIFDLRGKGSAELFRVDGLNDGGRG